MRRLAAVVIAVSAAACGASRAAGPAWPKSAGTERVGEAADDGGESLAPKPAAASVAVEQSDDDAPATAETPAAAAPAPAPTGGGAAPAPAADPQQPVMLDFEEEIVIDATPQP